MKIALKEIIGQLLNSKQQGSQEFLRLWNMGVFGLKTEFNLDITGDVVTAILDVNANKTVNLPCNYISYLKIGVINGKGEVATFKRNDQLSTLNSNFSNNRTAGAPIGGNDNFFYYNFYLSNNYYGYFYGGNNYQLFGANSGTPTLGEYKIDEAQKLIFLGQHCHYDKIVLEYLSDGYSEDGCDYMVDIRVAEAMKTYLRWQDAVDQPKKFAPGTVRMFKSEYYNQKRLAKMRINPFVLNEIQAVERASWKMAPKA